MTRLESVLILLLLFSLYVAFMLDGFGVTNFVINDSAEAEKQYWEQREQIQQLEYEQLQRQWEAEARELLR